MENELMARQTAQGKLLREARDALGINTEELAERLGVELVTVRSWLQGYRAMPPTAKVRLDYILGKITKAEAAALLFEIIIGSEKGRKK